MHANPITSLNEADTVINPISSSATSHDIDNRSDGRTQDAAQNDIGSENPEITVVQGQELSDIETAVPASDELCEVVMAAVRAHRETRLRSDITNRRIARWRYLQRLHAETPDDMNSAEEMRNRCKN